MKKTFLFVIAIILSCTSCVKHREPTSTSSVHQHQLLFHDAKEPTCVENGWKAYETCETCDYTTFEELPALNHKKGNPIQEKLLDATCKDEGHYEEVIYCTRCAIELERKEIKIEKKAHQLTHVEKKEPTCLESGFEAYDYCENCGYTTYQELPSLGHDYQERVEVVDGVTVLHYECIREDASYDKNCQIESAKGFTIDVTNYDYPMLLKTVSNSTTSVSFNNTITVSQGCTWTLSKDVEGLEIIPTKNISLVEGHNYVYLTVWSENEKYNTLYYVDIYRLSLVTYTFFNDNEIVEQNTVEENTEINAPSLEEKDHHHVSAWKDDQGNTMQFPYQVTQDITFYAEWSMNQYTVTFDVDGGIEIPSIRQEYNQTIALPSASKEGAQLYAWEDENHTQYEIGEEFLVLEDTTLKAIWVDGFAFHKNEDGTIEITKYIGNEKEVEFPSYATSILENAFLDNETVEKIVVPTTMKTIQKGAFYGIKALKSITLPFVGESKENPQNFGYIFGLEGHYLQQNYVPQTLEEVILLDGCLEIQEHSFRDLTGLKSVYIPSSVTRIGLFAFNSCDNLTIYCEVDAPLADWDAEFNGHNRPIVWSYAGKKGVYNGLSYVVCKKDDQTFISIMGLDTSIDEEETPKEIEIPEKIDGITVTTINAGAFSSSSLTRVVLPNTIKDIQKKAFSGSRDLVSINIPEGITEIKESTFFCCTSLKTIDLPSSVTHIEDGAFSSCDQLEIINLNEGLLSLGEHAFASCTSLVTIDLPDSLTEINPYAFAFCDQLKQITIPQKIENLSNSVFSYCKALENIVLPTNLQTIGENTFFYCTALTSITIPESVVKMGSSAFENCTSLVNIEIPNGITELSSGVFKNCTSLETVILNEGLTTIKNSAFEGCSALKNITIPNSVTSIKMWAFKDCTSLTSIIIPTNVTEIAFYAFYNCPSLTIYCRAESQPDGYDEEWNADIPVEWGYKE